MLPVLNLNTFIHDNGAQEKLTMQKLDNVIKSWINWLFWPIEPLKQLYQCVCHVPHLFHFKFERVGISCFKHVRVWSNLNLSYPVHLWGCQQRKKSRKVRCGGMPDIEIPSGKCHQCTCTWNSGHCISIFLYITTNQWSHYLREGILCFCKIVFFFSFRKSMEEDGNQGLLCWRRVYKETPKVWEVYQTNGEIFFLKQCQYALTPS